MQSENNVRGFVHLDDFDQLYEWSETQVDSLQRSNIPLLRRAQTDGTQEQKSKVMLIHDYEGSYLDYEACQGAVIEDEKYTCEYLQCVEVFVYFSHKLVTIPPPTWTNTCHRNGVKVLGTFIVEPDTLHIERTLEEQNGEFWVARQLANIAHAYNFDGWLINLEKPFPAIYWNNSGLEAFLRQLRSLLGPFRTLVWYDALIPLNVVWYQNTLNYLNLPFALAAGAILTNYAWNPALAKQAGEIAERSGLGKANLYFGIDAWAQNVHNGKNSRVTYPPRTGGGTGIGMGMKELTSFGINAGIFAPGWTFEHFEGYNREVEKAVWQGEHVSSRLQCDCTPSPNHLIIPYQDHSIERYAISYPAGSRSFFHTNFETAFTRIRSDSGAKFFAHLGRQSVLPIARRTPFTCGSFTAKSTYLCADINDNPLSCSFSTRSHANATTPHPRHGVAKLRLYDILISDERPVELTLAYKKIETKGVTLQLKVNDSRRIDFPDSSRSSDTIREQFLDTSDEPLRTLDLVLSGPYQDVWNLGSDFLSFTHLTIKPRNIMEPIAEIYNVHVKHCDYGGVAHHRLAWEISKEPPVLPEGIPYSRVTGPFAHFRIDMNDQNIGIAFALEFEMTSDVLLAVEPDEKVTIAITGVGFDGSSSASTRETFSWPSAGQDGWILV